MLITKLGEFGLIERIKKSMRLDSSVIQGIGDDCAVLKLDKLRYLLFTCDMLVEGVDFTARAKPYLIGRKAIAVSLSDIAACAGIPRHCLVSVGMPKGTNVSFTDKLIEGMRDIAEEFKVSIVGGDISRAEHLVIDVSMLGVVEKNKLALRNGAQKKDIICVSGSLGGSGSGKHLYFIPRIKEARFLVQENRINAMIDISDGLLQDLEHILKASNAGAIIYEELIPLSKEARSIDEALSGGEDFELLFTLSLSSCKKILSQKPRDFTAIGEIVDKKYGLRLVDKKGKEKKPVASGFRHF